MTKNILMVVTNVNEMAENHPTGLWLEEFAIPYTAFIKAGHKVQTASPLGGKIPLDPNSLGKEDRPEWQDALAQLEDTAKLQSLNMEDFDALILPGGHGPMFDLATDPLLAKWLKDFAQSEKVIGAVCHGPAALVSTVLDNGQSLVQGKNVTGFSNVEERAVQLDHLVPFLLEDKLVALGGNYSGTDAWLEYVVTDGNLITGQNPQSSGLFAEAVLARLAAKQ